MKIVQFLGILLMCLFLNNRVDGFPSVHVSPDLSDQLSPRLIYRKKVGKQPEFTDPVQRARAVLNKLGLEHLYLQVMQASKTYDGLLFEMKTYEQAREIIDKWRLYPNIMKNFYTKFELKQTERHFWE